MLMVPGSRGAAAFAKEVAMMTRSMGLAVVAGVALASSSARAQNLYAEELLRGSTYFLEMCLPPCACPYRGVQVAMHGTFTLRLEAIGDVFDFYAVENVRFVADTDFVETRITGSGTLRSGNVFPQQQMELDLLIQPEGRMVHVTSDVEPRRVDLPRLRATLASEQIVCGRYTLNINAGACVADTDDGSGTGTPDGGVTIDDLLFFLGVFEAGSLRADVDDGTGTGTPDGGVTIDDLLYYLLRFGNGC